jgi:cysteine desulfurase
MEYATKRVKRRLSTTTAGVKSKPIERSAGFALMRDRMERVYLDWNATAPLRPEARAAMAMAFDQVGNPSSVHLEGRGARRLVEEARAKVAALVGTESENVTFTSGGTEANMLALSPGLATGHGQGRPIVLLVSAIEHPSVGCGGQFPAGAVTPLPVRPEGTVDLFALGTALQAVRAKGARPLVSVMLANNETGVVQPISEVAAIVREAEGVLHVDAVQAPGRIMLDRVALGADLLTLSAHKIGGPKGAGALVRRSGQIHLAASLLRGGGQERGVRAGTENVPGIAGFGAAAQAVMTAFGEETARMRALRDRLETGLKEVAPNVVIFGEMAERLPNTTLFGLRGIKAETAVIAFDLEGVAVSSGAACSSGKVKPSHVLAAMGVDDELARAAIRVSLGPTTTEADVAHFLRAWNKLTKSLGKGCGLAA